MNIYQKTVDSVKLILKLTDEGFLNLTREIKECQELEDGFMAILTLEFVDEYINCLPTIDNIKKSEDGENKKLSLEYSWNVSDFRDCFLNYIKNLKNILKKFKKDFKKS